jgi:hypothetical protein
MKIEKLNGLLVNSPSNEDLIRLEIDGLQKQKIILLTQTNFADSPYSIISNQIESSSSSGSSSFSNLQFGLDTDERIVGPVLSNVFDSKIRNSSDGMTSNVSILEKLGSNIAPSEILNQKKTKVNNQILPPQTRSRTRLNAYQPSTSVSTATTTETATVTTASTTTTSTASNSLSLKDSIRSTEPTLMVSKLQHFSQGNPHESSINSNHQSLLQNDSSPFMKLQKCISENEVSHSFTSDDERRVHFLREPIPLTTHKEKFLGPFLSSPSPLSLNSPFSHNKEKIRAFESTPTVIPFVETSSSISLPPLRFLLSDSLPSAPTTSGHEILPPLKLKNHSTMCGNETVSQNHLCTSDNNTTFFISPEKVRLPPLFQNESASGTYYRASHQQETGVVKNHTLVDENVSDSYHSSFQRESLLNVLTHSDDNLQSENDYHGERFSQAPLSQNEGRQSFSLARLGSYKMGESEGSQDIQRNSIVETCIPDGTKTMSEPLIPHISLHQYSPQSIHYHHTSLVPLINSLGGNLITQSAPIWNNNNRNFNQFGGSLQQSQGISNSLPPLENFRPFGGLNVKPIVGLGLKKDITMPNSFKRMRETEGDESILKRRMACFVQK